MKNSFYDVAIVGGGPGGSATAISLLAHAPTLSIVVIEASRYDAYRIGETLPPLARPILEHLKLWDGFCGLDPRTVFGTTAAWGQANALDNDFLYWPANTGWHINRASFDALLATSAEDRGAELLLDTSVRSAEWVDGQWSLKLSTGTTLSARFIVDATGRAVLARRLGARLVGLDRLVGIARFFDKAGDNPRLLVEAFEDGWWYTAGLPDGKRVAGCMTDADLAHRMRLGEPEEWERRLATMPNVAALTQKGRPCSPIIVRSTASRRLEPVATERWLAVGDAASRFDPLSSQGIMKALRSGIFASYAIGDWLIQGSDSGLRRYRRIVTEEFTSYAKVRAKYYLQEQRWPASEFWSRRHQAVTPDGTPALPAESLRT
jgi:flavin-dependent dehydrogenase